jgi:hypothetical protein
MTRKMGISIATFALAAASASTASAQVYEGELAPRGPVRAPSNAFEIQIDTGYQQGFGPMIPATEGTGSTGLGNAGVGVGLGLGYRINPNASVGVTGSFNQQAAPGGTTYRGATAGVEAALHASPHQRLDPWLSFGAGYRMHWEMPQAAEATNDGVLVHGFQLAKAKVGLDVRVSDSVAIAPTVGADLNMFLWRDPEGRVATQTIDTPRLNTFVFAGVQGRFDVGGVRTR